MNWDGKRGQKVSISIAFLQTEALTPTEPQQTNFMYASATRLFRQALSLSGLSLDLFCVQDERGD